jgi:hypothetical protein
MFIPKNIAGRRNKIHDNGHDYHWSIQQQQALINVLKGTAVFKELVKGKAKYKHGKKQDNRAEIV